MAPTDRILEVLGTGVEGIVLILLLWRRSYKTLPVFCAYVAWSIVNDLFEPVLVARHPTQGLVLYDIALAIDSLFQFGVLIELSGAVLRPLKNLLPRWTPLGIAILLALVCAIAWPFAAVPGGTALPLAGRLLYHLQQSVSVLRIVFFLAIAGCSQLLSIGWRDRELQVATGWGFFSMVSLTVSILHRSQAPDGQAYHMADLVTVASYDCSLLYWVFCFAQREAERREFTPQMQNFLLSLAGNASATRSSFNKKRKDED